MLRMVSFVSFMRHENVVFCTEKFHRSYLLIYFSNLAAYIQLQARMYCYHDNVMVMGIIKTQNVYVRSTLL